MFKPALNPFSKVRINKETVKIKGRKVIFPHAQVAARPPRPATTTTTAVTAAAATATTATRRVDRLCNAIMPPAMNRVCSAHKL